MLLDGLRDGDIETDPELEGLSEALGLTLALLDDDTELLGLREADGLIDELGLLLALPLLDGD